MVGKANKTIVAFFCGTSYDFDKEAKGYVSQLEMKVSPARTVEERNTDEGLSLLNEILAEDQERYGYDGCHQRGGGAFAYGIEQPIEHLFAKLKNQVRQGHEKITLVLTAHSRGCLSALGLSKKLNANKELKDRIEVVLDLRDPVPGNFKLTSSLPIAKYATSAHQLEDLRTCTNIKSVHVTVQEKGNLDYAFDVLIPRFSLETKLEVDFIPGLHDIQERDLDGMEFYRDERRGYIVASPLLHFLGLCQSLQIYSEANVSINYKKTLENFKEHLLVIDSENTNLHYLDKLINMIDALEKSAIQKNEFDFFIERTQLILYDEILIECKRHPDKKILKRHLHFGGEFQAIGNLRSSTHLNMQHALLAEKYRPLGEVELLLDFKGRRPDLSKNDRAAKALEELKNECLRYLEYYENREIDPNKIELVQSMYNLIKTKPSSPSFEVKAGQLGAFAERFDQAKSIFKNSPDYRTRKFVIAISHVIAGFISIGIYNGIRSAHLRSSQSISPALEKLD